MENCLVTKLNGVVNNNYLPKMSEYVLELINQPGRYPQRSGMFQAKAGTKLQVRCLTPNVEFANGRGTSFEIDGDASETEVNRSIGLTGDGVVAIGPKENIKQIGSFAIDHILEIPFSLNSIVNMNDSDLKYQPISINSVNDNQRIIDINNIKNISIISPGVKIPGLEYDALYSLDFSYSANRVHIDIDELLEMFYNNHNYGVITIVPSDTEWPKFLNESMYSLIGTTVFVITSNGINGWESGHVDDSPNYLKCQYDGNSWTLVNQNN